MTTLLTLGICSLYTFWVWHLKHELKQNHADDTKDGIYIPRIRPHKRVVPQRKLPASGPEPEPGSCVRENGVPTWIID